MTTSVKWLIRAGLIITLLLSGPVLMVACSHIQSDRHWYNADRSSAGIAPQPQTEPAAVVQVYGARAFGWRGYFAVHTWIATKAANADHYVVHDVTGWGSQTVRSRTDDPDRAWYGNQPQLLADIRGERAARMIPEIIDAVNTYPYPEYYKAWPGPNSNTFVAWVIRQVPELNVALPNIAIGKDYLPGKVIAATPSSSGYQVSLFGYLGVLASLREGLEFNVLGLSVGINPMALGIKLPGVGEIGLLEPWMDSPPELQQ